MPDTFYSSPEDEQQALADYYRSLNPQIPQQMVGQGAANAVNNLFAPVGDVPRYQTWPETMVRSGATLPVETYRGNVPTNLGLRREDFTDIPDERKPSDTFVGRNLGLREGKELGPSGELIERTQDLAGMAGGGSVVNVERGNAGTLGTNLIRNEAADMLAMQKQHYQGILRADSAEAGAPLAALERAPVFFSAVEKAVKDAKMPKADGEQWLGYLRNQPGVKQEELDWVLGDLPKGQITKSELEQFVKDHKIELKEITKDGKTIPKDASFFREYAGLNQEEWNNLNSQQREQIVLNYKRDNVNPTKYSQWQLPGGNSYREQLLTLPEKESAHEIAIQKRMSEIDKETNGDYTPEYKTLQQEYSNIRQQAYTSSHWNEPNVLAHIRTNERQIPGVGNSLHIEEIQSDWHQVGRKQGYKGEAEKLKPDFDAIEKKIVDSGDEAVMSHPELKDALAEAIKKKIITADEAKTYARYVQIENTKARSPVPDAPFKTNWADLALKRIIRHAAETGKDSISWTPGESNRTNPKNMGRNDAQAERADRGIRNFYDVELVNKANAIAKKFGGKVESNVNTVVKTPAVNRSNEFMPRELLDEIDTQNKGKENNQPVHVLRITPQLRDAALNKGFSLFADSGKVGAPLAALTRVEHNPFTTDAYHGTGSGGFKGTKIEHIGENEFYSTSSPHEANEWAQAHETISPGQGSAVLPLKLDTRNYHVVDGTGKKYSKIQSDEIENAIKLGKQGVIFKNVTESNNLPPTNIFVTLDNGTVRSKFASFNVKDFGKSGLLLSDTSDNAALTALAKQHSVNLTPVEHNPFTVDTYHGTRGFTGDKISPKSNYDIHEDTFTGKPTYSVWDSANKKTIGHNFRTKAEAETFIDKRVGSEFFHTTNPALASDYAAGGVMGSQVLPLKTNTKDYHTFDAKGSDWRYANKHAIFEAEQLGKKGVIIKNVIDDAGVTSHGPQTVYITLDPSTVRSRFAKFDPAKFHESGLMKASGLPIITDKDGNQLDHNLKPMTIDEQNALLNRNPLPTHKGADGKAVAMPSKTALALAAAKAAEYAIWAVRPTLGPQLWAASILGGAVMNARSLKQRREGQPLGGYKLTPVDFNPFK